MKQKIIFLDGINNGYMLYMLDSNKFAMGNSYMDPETKKFTRVPNQRILFTNLDNTLAYANAVIPFRASYMYKLWMLVDGIEVDYDEVNLFEDHLEYIHEDGTMYIIYEIVKDKMLEAGYFVFNNNESAKNHSKDAKNNYEAIRRVVSKYTYRPFEYHIEKLFRDENKFMTLFIKRSSLKIHFCLNSSLMDLNAKRKAAGIRCIPFLKDMDKFNTIYCFATKDINDYAESLEESKRKLHELIKCIEADLQLEYPDVPPVFSQIEFNGVVIANEEVL